MNKQTLEIACREYTSDSDHNGAWGHFLAELFLKQKADEELEQRAEFENYLYFIQAVKKSRINIENKFADRIIKEEFMKKYFGYKKLNGFNSLEECPDFAIGKAFENKYNSALKRIKIYVGGEGK